MDTLPDGNKELPSLSREFSSEAVTMDLTMCGLLVDRVEELALLYREHGNWNAVKEVWFTERRGGRSTKGSSQKIYRVLTSRLKNALSSLPNPRDLPAVLDNSTTSTDKAQILYFYLVADDPLVRFIIHEYVQRQFSTSTDIIDFSNETLKGLLSNFEYADGTSFDYAESTTERWCEGFRSVMREIGVLEDQQTTADGPPSIGDIPLLVAMGYSYEKGGDNWLESPLGLQYLFQPETRWEELYDRVANTDWWTYSELHGSLQLRPIDGAYSWIEQEVQN